MKNIRKGDILFHMDLESGKWFDPRALIPALIISFLWALYVAFYIPVMGIAEFILSQLSITANAVITDAAVIGLGLLLQLFIFFVDFFLVFTLVYALIWIINRERDKKLYYSLKDKGKI